MGGKSNWPGTSSSSSISPNSSEHMSLEVGHVSTSHGIVKESPTLILVPTPHLLQLGADSDLPDALVKEKENIKGTE